MSSIVSVKIKENFGCFPVARSQAKQLIDFIIGRDEVLLDFAGIAEIGQAFADEIFRVFSRSHPEVELLPINANEDVMRMIRRAQSALRAEGNSPPSPA